jgi:hypothetical protein
VDARPGNVGEAGYDDQVDAGAFEVPGDPTQLLGGVIATGDQDGVRADLVAQPSGVLHRPQHGHREPVRLEAEPGGDAGTDHPVTDVVVALQGVHDLADSRRSSDGDHSVQQPPLHPHAMHDLAQRVALHDE